MTNEEAIKILKGAIKKPNTKDGYLGQALDMAIKALEQTDTLDRIIARIEQVRDKDKIAEYPYNRCIRIIKEYKEK